MMMKYFILVVTCTYVATMQLNQFCVQGMSSVEQQEELKLNSEVVAQLKETFGQQPKIISKIFEYVFKKNQQILSLFPKILSKVEFFKFKALAICIIIILFVRFIPYLRNIYQSVQINIPKEKINIGFTIIVTILCISTVAESFKGIKQSKKYEKNINHFLCKALSNPINILRGSKIQGINELQRYVDEASSDFISSYTDLKPALFRLQATQTSIQAAELILSHLQKTPQSNEYEKRLASARDVLKTAYSYSIVRPRTLYDAYRIPNRILQVTLLVNSLTKSITYIANKFHIKRVIEFATDLSSLFFYFVGLVAVAAGCLLYLLYKSTKLAAISQIITWLQYFLTIALVICLLVFITASCLLPGIFWTSNSTGFALSNEGNFFQEFKLLNDFNPQIPQSISMIIPIDRDIMKIYNGNFLKQTNTIIQAFEPYITQNATYFYDLYSESLNYINSSESRQKIQKILEQYFVKHQNFIQPMTITHNALKSIKNLYKEGGSIWKINGNILGRYLADLGGLFFIITQNRLYSIKQICEIISFNLLLILILILVIVEKKPQKPNEDTTYEQAKRELNQIY